MAAVSTRLFLYFFYLCSCWILSIHVRLASSVSFSFDFSDPSPNLSDAIILQGDAFIGPSTLEVTRDRRNMEDIIYYYSVGRASYAQKVLLWDGATGEVASFTTNFSFRISLDSGNPHGAGDGLAFFLGHFPSEIPINSAGGGLGLLTFPGRPANLTAGDQRVVAVEFDTVLNPEVDPTWSHVGIDVNSLNSLAYVDMTTPSNNLTSGTLMIAAVKYDNLTKVLSVDLQINGSTFYHVNAMVDMRSSLPGEVAVGFSAATGMATEVHQILSWSFSSTLEPKTTTANSMQPKFEASKLILISVLIPLLVLMAFAAVAVGCFLIRRRREHMAGCGPSRSTESDSEEEEEEDERAELERGVAAAGPRRYTYRALAAATRNFAEEEKLGRGGFGGVYRGNLTVGDQDRPVAIKMLSASSSAQGRSEFEAEVRTISRLKHRCLVQLLGWCDSRKGLLLVYELVVQGSLDRHLYNNQRLLTWPERHQIILGLGSALRYLHGESVQCVVHGDIKPSNIMLDSSYRTKLGDFGLAKLVDHGARLHTTRKVQGTMGYIDPEFVNTGRLSTESDVYSFGIVLLEIVSGRRPVVETADGIFALLRWVWSLYGRNAILDAVDRRLAGDELQMERALVSGLWCAHPDRSERPSMAQVMYVLETEDARPPELLPRMYTALTDELAVAAYRSLSIDGVALSSATFRSATTVNTTRSSHSTALLRNSGDML